MDRFDSQPQAPKPQWTGQSSSSNEDDCRALQQRIGELEAQIRSYEALLAELPDLFERKFQQRLEPLLERYKLLAEQSSNQQAGKPALMSDSSDNVVRFPIPRIAALLRRHQRSA
ncbi:MAG: hypothetical protein CL862_08655 [Cyanobium sp. NAT70]|nr:hypothetical protein [Cyanobium sp. NAT70]|tara:strand:- start:7206 stop:7550 length:345 start_codon:yes stop_codon:yes gene_type:complete